MLLLAPRVFQAPEAPAARETRQPRFARCRVSKPARALRSLRRPPNLWSLAAVRAGGRQPAREIATRKPDGSEWSISRPALALPPPTGTAAWPTTIPQHSRPALTPLIPAPTPNFACNSPATISNLEFRSLELQRFQTLLKIRPIELHATFA